MATNATDAGWKQDLEAIEKSVDAFEKTNKTFHAAFQVKMVDIASLIKNDNAEFIKAAQSRSQGEMGPLEISL